LFLAQVVSHPGPAAHWLPNLGRLGGVSGRQIDPQGLVGALPPVARREVRVPLGVGDGGVAEDRLELPEVPTGHGPLGREGVARRLVPGLGLERRKPEVREDLAEVLGRRALVDVLAVAPHGRDDEPLGSGLELPGLEDRDQGVL
jgi:hypothetical protein